MHYRHPFCLALAGAAVWASAAAAETALPLERVLLSTGGVGYFEHEAVVDGDAHLALDVRLDQVDDVLKSVVVYDDQGGVGSVSLPGRRPLEELFRGLPFGRAALESPVALLNALQGAVVRVDGARVLEGRVLRVEPETVTRPDDGTVTQHRVTLLTGDGLQQFILEQADSLRFADPVLGDQVERALAGVAAHRVQDVRTLDVALTGDGERRVRVAYVVEAPLWKATYRLVMPGDGAAETAYLQGWAVVENMTGGDWRDVELTLLSGNPVTFRQALYTAYYVDRPEVPVEVLGRVLPAPDEGVVRRGDGAAAQRKSEAPTGAEALRTMGLAAMAEADAAPEAMAAAPSEPTPGVARTVAAEAREAATQVMFHVPHPVSVASGHSLMVPIVDRGVPARRVVHYQPEVHARHPLASVDLVNDGGSGLPPGVLTLYERTGDGVSYVGDARLATLPAGESRLVGFAVDGKTTISRETASTQEIAGGSISGGVFRLTRRQRRTTVYRLKAPANAARIVIIDHPRQPDWALVEPDEKSVALTDGDYRIEVALVPGEETEVPVVVERPVRQDLGIASLSIDDAVRFSATDALEPAVRRAFERLAELRRSLDDAERRVAQLERERDAIHREQGRIRENLARVPRDSDLYRRYLEKLEGQEDRLEEIEAATDAARRTRNEAQRRLAEFIDRLEL